MNLSFSQTLQGMDKKAQVLAWQYVDEIINCNHIGPLFLFVDTGGGGWWLWREVCAVSGRQRDLWSTWSRALCRQGIRPCGFYHTECLQSAGVRWREGDQINPWQMT